jgi:hypothetical protein
MRRLSIGTGLGIVVAAGCTITTGEEPPPPPTWGVPISGGTMTVTRDGNRAVVADPDRDRVVIVDLVTEQIADTITLEPGSEPGRAIDDGTGRIHVALRSSGQLLTITGVDRQLRPICGEPRGIAWQETGDLVHVACATGELVSVPAGGGDPVRTLRLERDLRDVIVRDTGLVVTKFRSAELLQLDADGLIVARISPPVLSRFDFSEDGGSNAPAIPAVAWRTIALPDGSVMMSHQRRLGTTLRVITGGYGAACGGPVESALTIVDKDNVPFAVAPVTGVTLPIDVAVNPISGDVAIISAGNDVVFVVPRSSTSTPDKGGCTSLLGSPIHGIHIGTPTAIAYRPNGALVVFYPESDGITIHDGGTPRGVSLGGRPATDAGRTLFHARTSVGLACASCHPEGRDDGAVWSFDTLGLRRTQNLGGGILSRAPYHWGGDMPTMHALVQDVFTQRMAGTPVSAEQERALVVWLDRVPAPRGVITDAAAVARGDELFHSAETGCVSCHTGALLTNNKLANVGNARLIKVPSLIGVGARAPFMHDGCAATLRDRFGACGGDSHGRTAQLGEAELGDLIAYLESL